jgi:formylmethanofuran dehydrogenase subunit E
VVDRRYYLDRGIAQPYQTHNYRLETHSRKEISFTFSCSKCKQRKALLGHKKRNGIKVCKHCLEKEARSG